MVTHLLSDILAVRLEINNSIVNFCSVFVWTMVRLLDRKSQERQRHRAKRKTDLWPWWCGCWPQTAGGWPGSFPASIDSPSLADPRRSGHTQPAPCKKKGKLKSVQKRELKSGCQTTAGNKKAHSLPKGWQPAGAVQLPSDLRRGQNHHSQLIPLPVTGQTGCQQCCWPRPPAAEAPADHPLPTENWPPQTAEPPTLPLFPTPMNILVGQEPRPPEHVLQTSRPTTLSPARRGCWRQSWERSFEAARKT